MIRWMSPQALGRSTSKVSTDFLTQNGLEVVSEWHHSPHEVDLFIWQDSGQKVIKFQIGILGQIVEWSFTGGLKTGMVVEQELLESNGPKMKGSELVHYDEIPLLSTLTYAIQVIHEMKDLKPSQKALLVDYISKPKKTSGIFSLLLQRIFNKIKGK